LFLSGVGVWLEYVQFAIGGMGEPNGIQKVRSLFERAITAVGLHVTKGSMIWDACREFENAILDGLEVKATLNLSGHDFFHRFFLREIFPQMFGRTTLSMRFKFLYSLLLVQ